MGKTTAHGLERGRPIDEQKPIPASGNTEDTKTCRCPSTGKVTGKARLKCSESLLNKQLKTGTFIHCKCKIVDTQQSNLTVPQMTKQRVITGPSNSTPKTNKNTSTQNLCRNVDSSIMPNTPRVEASPNVHQLLNEKTRFALSIQWNVIWS